MDRKFKVWVKDKGWKDGSFRLEKGVKPSISYSTHNKPGYIQLTNYSLFCPYCQEIWAKVDWLQHGIKEGNCCYVRCKEHGGNGLLMPLRAKGVDFIEYPYEVYVNDFLILMEHLDSGKF